ncbi:hypothetical protein SAMN06265222_1533 [Neorhodopirellula lusitana]|uniref:Uncharacterized protein n=1 Tax=Neorhodopirellula lusitana TaxID=445327 RepID=A0ABY1QVK7_9BACT|nr:hypothetical protein [Neorhodopirellula lusitana]SMP80430.1 hypothetical protein SAMN06265222_1533 [Neorhodopirellula lusitana]
MCSRLFMLINDRPAVVSHSRDLGFFIQGADRARYPIQHCPWCGDLLPKRIADGLIAPEHEHVRILDKAKGVVTPEDCYALFGEPDYDAPFPDDNGMPTDLRNIEYYGISDWYTLEFYFTPPDYRRFVINAKPIPLLEDAEP